MTRPSRGQLRIYLGAAAGVGKTYQMLGDARLAVEEGVDLVIGYLEPHGRSRTEDRARDLEMAPAHRVRGRRPGVDRARRRVDPRAAAVDRVHGRARAHERDRGAAAQALRGRRAPPLARHRGVVHRQRAASREPARPRPRADGRRRARDVPGRAAARRRRDPPHRSQPARAARAHRAGAGVPGRPHRAGADRLLHLREPRDPARDRAARDGGGRGSRGAARRGPVDDDGARARLDRRALGLERPADPRGRSPRATRRRRAARARGRAAGWPGRRRDARGARRGRHPHAVARWDVPAARGR